MRIGKFIIIFGLALLLIGIAYIRALVSHQNDRTVIPSEAVSSVPANLLDSYVQKEDAQRRLDSICRLYTDSLTGLKSAWSASVDSQSREKTESLRLVIDELERKLTRAEKAASQAKDEKTQKFEKLVAAFYNGEVAQLPADLSDYERGVSLNEIRDKAQKYFGVSSQTLNRILSKYK